MKPLRYVILPCVHDSISYLQEDIGKALGFHIPNVPVRMATPEEIPQLWSVYANMEDGTQVWKKGYTTKQEAQKAAEELNNTTFCEDFNLAWDYKVLAITKTHVLVFLEDECKQEYVSYSHDNQGNCHSGVYTRDRQAAIANFVERMRVHL